MNVLYIRGSNTPTSYMVAPDSHLGPETSCLDWCSWFSSTKQIPW